MTAALTEKIVHDLGRRETSCFASIRASLRRAPWVILVATIAGLAILAGASVFVIPGLVIMTMLWVVMPVTVVERRGVFASILRSTDLTRGHRWRIFAILCCVGMVHLAATAVIMATAGGSGNVVIYFLAYSANLVFFAALWAAVIAVSYNDLCMAEIKAGLDPHAAVFD